MNISQSINGEIQVGYISEKNTQLEGLLIERVNKNLADYHESLLGFGKPELIDMAGMIVAMSDAHQYMTSSHGFSEDELRFYLQFGNPLEVVADAWYKHISDLYDMDLTMDFISAHRETLLTEYPLASDIFAEKGQRRFMGVDLIEFLGKIADQVIIHYPNDFKTDIKSLNRFANSDNQVDKRLMWHVSSYGTHLNTERDTFIKDTGAYNTWVDYRPNDPDMFGHVIEITGKKGHIIMGNVFEVGNYAQHANYVRDTALPLDAVTLTYSSAWGVNAGKTITVPRFEYDNDRHRLMSESGDVIAINYHPAESAREMSALLRHERSQRMAYPIGSQQAHLDKLSAKLAEIRQPPDKTVERTDPNTKRSLIERLQEAKKQARSYNAQRSQEPTNNIKKHNKEID